MDYKQMTAPCGLDCFNCILYSGYADKNRQALVLKEASRSLSICKGCRNENGNCPNLPMPCNVYPCAGKRGVAFCCECSDFPCDYLHPYADRASELPHNTKVFNLCLIKKMGLESWAKDKAISVKKVYYYDQWKL